MRGLFYLYNETKRIRLLWLGFRRVERRGKNEENWMNFFFVSIKNNFINSGYFWLPAVLYDLFIKVNDFNHIGDYYHNFSFIFRGFSHKNKKLLLIK